MFRIINRGSIEWIILRVVKYLRGLGRLRPPIFGNRSITAKLDK